MYIYIRICVCVYMCMYVCLHIQLYRTFTCTLVLLRNKVYMVESNGVMGEKIVAMKMT